MNTSALIMMITVESIVIIFTGLFFYLVLTKKSTQGDDTEE